MLYVLKIYLDLIIEIKRIDLPEIFSIKIGKINIVLKARNRNLA